jgi:hypothetical protein
MVEVTRFTSHQPNRLSKAFHLDNGYLTKQSGGQLFDGTAERLSVDLTGFADLLATLTPRQALAYGVSSYTTARVVPARNLPAQPSKEPTIARDRQHFAWPDGAGVLMLDYDAPPDDPPLDCERLREAIYSVWSELRAAPHIWRPSAGGCIYNADTGEELRGVSGQRLYVLVANSADIPRAGAVLFDRLWLAGHGRFEVSRSGALLSRTIIDGTVFQPERLDFCGGADCGPGLVQRLSEPLVINPAADAADTTRLYDLSPQELAELRAIREMARATLAGAVSVARESWIEDRVAVALSDIPAERQATQRPELVALYRRACEDARLLADFVLHTEAHSAVSVGVILDNPEKFHGCRTLDPLEPDYNGGRYTGWLNLRTAGRPYLFSHAHGGKKFTLHRALQTIRVEGGELHHMADKALALLRLDGVVYQRGQSLGRLAGELIHSVCADWMTLYLTRLCRFEKLDKRRRVWESIDCPPRLAASVCAMAGDWNLPALRAVVSAPFIMSGGRIVERDGYDAESGLYLDFAQAEQWTPVPDKPTTEQVRSAVRELWRPFKDFPFTGPVDRGVFMSALLTAIQRPMLPTAPGFSMDAPAAGSGKSLLAKCLCTMAGVPSPEVMPPIKAGDDSEIRKRLFAACRAGARAILFDNAVGQVDSPALCAFLTAEVFGDRILGLSENGAAPTTAMVIFTGNNNTMVGDLNRRMLRARIDPAVEAPHRRKFTMNPAAYVQENRLALVRAGLIVLRGYLLTGDAPTDSMASFEAWNDLVRGAVIWLSELVRVDGEPFFGDPAESIDATYDLDPERARLGALLSAWHGAFKSRQVLIREVSREAEMIKEQDPALFDALDDISGGRGVPNGQAIRRYLERMAERIVDGLRFRRGADDSHAKQARWFVENLNLRVVAGYCGLSPQYAGEMASVDSCNADTKLPAIARHYPQTPPPPICRPVPIDDEHRTALAELDGLTEKQRANLWEGGRPDGVPRVRVADWKQRLPAGNRDRLVTELVSTGLVRVDGQYVARVSP